MWGADIHSRGGGGGEGLERRRKRGRRPGASTPLGEAIKSGSHQAARSEGEIIVVVVFKKS